MIKREEAFNPHIPVVYLGFEYQSVHEAGRRGFTVKPTNKCLDERLDIVQLRNAKGGNDAFDRAEEYEPP